MNKTEVRRIVREARAELQSVVSALDDKGFSSESRKAEWIGHRLENVDGFSAMLREALVDGEG